MLFKIVIRDMRKSNKKMIFPSSRIYFFRDTFLHFYLHFWLFLKKILNRTKFP